jgi:hypothetical protein
MLIGAVTADVIRTHETLADKGSIKCTIAIWR